jgi:hypothetical protein
MSDSSALIVEAHRVLCSKCQEWVTLDPYVRFSVLKWERHIRECAARRKVKDCDFDKGTSG